MAKIICKENYRVEVEVPTHTQLGRPLSDKEMKYHGELIAKLITRHVDGVGSVKLKVDKVGRCSHCNYFWSNDQHPFGSDKFNGGCCAEDMKNEPQIL